ncbi:DUF397 domain-containing protein [Spirillospora sp. NPDC048832]|jgi:hypothetical protein
MSLHDDLSKARWRKASQSSASGSDCVEIARVPGMIALRDSKDPDGPKLLLAHSNWRELAGRVRAGEVDV